MGVEVLSLQLPRPPDRITHFRRFAQEHRLVIESGMPTPRM